jgi:multidrug resistance efflux pump
MPHAFPAFGRQNVSESSSAAIHVLVASGLIASLAGACTRPAESSRAPEAPAPSAAAAPVSVGPLRLTGTVEALRSRAVTVPRLQGTVTPMIITRLVPPGTRVEEGDLLVQFDRQEQQRLAFERRAEVVDLDGQIGKKRSEQTAAEAKDQTELTAAENDVARAKLDMQKNPLVSRVEAEKNALSLEQATAKLAQLRTTYDLKRKAAAADLKILEIRRDRAETARQHAERNSSLMEIRAPFAGLVVIKTMYRGGTGFVEIIEGDEVRPGAAIIDIVDTSVMQVRARVNQADANLVQAGQPATIRLDGFPALEFHGRVEQVAPLATTSSLSLAVRSLTAVVSIKESHEQLLPDLTASVEITPGPAPPSTANADRKS